MPETKAFCKECKSFKISCNGCPEYECYTGCASRKHWLDSGNKVKIKRHNEIVTIKRWDWVTGNYFVEFENGRVCPFMRDELEEVAL